LFCVCPEYNSDEGVLILPMTRKLAIALAFAGSSALAGWAQATPATPAATTAAVTPPTTKIGVVNLQAAVAYTNEGQRDLTELQKKFEPTQTELKGANDEIETLKKQLEATKDKLSDDERAKRVQAIEAKQKALERKFEDYQNDFGAQQQEIFDRILKQLYPVLDDFAKKNAFSVVVDASGQASPILWAADSTNITQALIDAYNVKSGIAAPAKPAGTPVKRPATGGTTTPK
jgi:Skp family chaperone for outer membrane proteins